MRGRAAQVDAAGRFEAHGLRRLREPRLPFAQPEEDRGARAAPERPAFRCEQRIVGIGERATVVFEHDDACLGPEGGEGVGVVAQVVGAIQRAVDERERRRVRHTVKLLPQPHVVFALGLRMTNCAPCRLSL